VDGGRDLDLARRGRSARCTRGGLAAGDAGRTRECDVGILVERSRSTAPKQIAAKVRESGTTPTEIAVIGPPVGATILGEVATSKGSGPGPPFPRCRERPRWLVLGALCRAECLPHRGEAHRLVYASTTEWPDGSHVESLMEISLQWLDGRTLLTLTQRGVPSGDVERGFTEGWNEFLDGLVARIQTRPAT
jgi:hypothetical protein